MTTQSSGRSQHRRWFWLSVFVAAALAVTPDAYGVILYSTPDRNTTAPTAADGLDGWNLEATWAAISPLRSTRPTSSRPSTSVTRPPRLRTRGRRTMSSSRPAQPIRIATSAFTRSAAARSRLGRRSIIPASTVPKSARPSRSSAAARNAAAPLPSAARPTAGIGVRATASRAGGRMSSRPMRPTAVRPTRCSTSRSTATASPTKRPSRWAIRPAACSSIATAFGNLPASTTRWTALFD